MMWLQNMAWNSFFIHISHAYLEVETIKGKFQSRQLYGIQWQCEIVMWTDLHAPW